MFCPLSWDSFCLDKVDLPADCGSATVAMMISSINWHSLKVVGSNPEPRRRGMSASDREYFLNWELRLLGKSGVRPSEEKASECPL